MWIPYDIRASLKAETDPSSVRLSRADDSEREFLVGFFLRNPVTQAWELDLVASAAGQDLSSDATPAGMRIGFHGNDAGKLSEVIYRLRARSAKEALALAHDDFSRRLLRYLAEIGRGMSIAGWRIADTTHGARWRCTPFRPSAMNVDFDALPALPADLAPLVELFQRARNAPDAASRLMAGFAVLHAAASGHAALSHAGVPAFEVSQEMLIHSGAMDHVEQIRGMTLPQLVDWMAPEHARLMSPEGVLAAVSGDLGDQQRLAQVANLADHVAHRLIAAEIRGRKAATEPAYPYTTDPVQPSRDMPC